MRLRILYRSLLASLLALSLVDYSSRFDRLVSVSGQRYFAAATAANGFVNLLVLSTGALPSHLLVREHDVEGFPRWNLDWESNADFGASTLGMTGT